MNTTITKNIAVRANEILKAWVNEYCEAEEQMIEDGSDPETFNLEHLLFSYYLSEDHPHNADLFQILSELSNRMIGLNEDDFQFESLAHEMAHAAYTDWTENRSIWR